MTTDKRGVDAVVHADIPEAVTSWVAELLGAVDNIQPLSGIAGPGAFRVHLTSGSVIVKGSQAAGERLFYERYAPRVREAGVGIPGVYGTAGLEGRHWVVMEDIPSALPRSRWELFDDTITQLARLHARGWNEPLADAVFSPLWDDAVTQAALTWCGDAAIGDALVQAQHQSAEIFQPYTWLSGDPNPTNWRVRSDGTLVLLDWERFCLGHPAIDLAILLPGANGFRRETAEQAARLWMARSPRYAGSVEMLADAMQLAKLWSAVEFLAGAAREPERWPPGAAASLVDHLPMIVAQRQWRQHSF